MLRTMIALLFIGLAGVAQAQQQPVNDAAVYKELLAEANNRFVAASVALATAQARIVELEKEKVPPKPPTPPSK